MTETAEISTSVVAPYSPRMVVANRRTGPRWRRLAVSTSSSTPGWPSQRSSGSPSAWSSFASCAMSRKAALAVMMRPSWPVTTKASGTFSTSFSSFDLALGRTIASASATGMPSRMSR